MLVHRPEPVFSLLLALKKTMREKKDTAQLLPVSFFY
jgi:hypothetical protein